MTYLSRFLSSFLDLNSVEMWIWIDLLNLVMSEIKIYNLRIVPPEPIFQEIVQIKHEFEFVFGKQPLSQSKPHITLAAFKMYPQDEEILFKIFNQLAEIKKFQIGIQGFDIFENKSNTLYIKVLNTEEIKKIHTQLKILWIRDLHKELRSINISSTPHITISKTDGNKMLRESLDYFQEKEYVRQFEVSQLTLVSRKEYKTWDWEYQIELKADF